MSASILIGIPHGGTRLPSELVGALREDLDHDFLLSQSDAYTDELFSTLGVDHQRFEWSRLVVDPNRSPRNRGRAGAVPRVDFDERSLFAPGMEPDEAEILRRIERWHAPYHAALSERLERGGYALFIDGHSMAATSPARGPSGLTTRPLVILGNGGDERGELASDERALSCPPPFARQALELLRQAFADHPAPAAPGLVSDQGELCLNRVFRGGYGIRHHSGERRNRYGLQLELNQGLWCDPVDFTLHTERLDWMRTVLRQWLAALDHALSV